MKRPWHSSLFWLYGLRDLPSGSRTVFTKSDGGMWVAAAHNLSLGLFWEYTRSRFLKTAKYDKDLKLVFDTIEESVVIEARRNPKMSGLDLERATLNSFQRFIAVNVDGVALANGYYSMRLVGFGGKTRDWIATPVKDADIPAIIGGLPPGLLTGDNLLFAPGF